MFCPSIFKKNISIIILGGFEPPDPSPLIYALVYSEQKKYHATAVCKLRCIEVIFVIK